MPDEHILVFAPGRERLAIWCCVRPSRGACALDLAAWQCDPENQSLSTSTMSQVPSTTSTSSTNFETFIAAAALKEYKKKTKKDIASHPLTAELKSCQSTDAILAILRAQVQVFDKSQTADEKLTKWLDPTVNVLYAFSAILGDAAGLVIAGV